VLVVLQFTVSTALIIGTVIVFQQIQYAKNRPVGYNVNNLINVTLQSDNINKQYQSFKNDLLNSGVVSSVAQSESLMTDVYITNSGFKWTGKDPNLQEEFVTMAVSPEFGKTVGWQLVAGRDFDPATYRTDSMGLIANETAVKLMGLKQPIGETIVWNDRPFKIIGVVKDMVNQNAYATAPPNLFSLHRFAPLTVVNIKLNTQISTHVAIDKISAIFKKYDPSMPFAYQFTDQNYAAKFDNEEHIGRLSTCLAALAIFISCLGLFGMASFMAEQRIKEIGVRKVLGASVFNLWQLLSKDFVVLVVVSLLIATPVAYYGMHRWLLNYQYRTEIAWWVFAITAVAALLITLATVSYQSIKAALRNPVTSLRSE
jgi:putative ABC transport system permease protein